MAKQQTWHKVIGSDGFAIYRASQSRVYASYNPQTGSFSSKMLAGNVPVEVLPAAPKTIRAKGEAWGHQVVRTYLEGERPVTHVFAYKGRGPRVNYRKAEELGIKEWKEIAEKCMDPADPEDVHFDHYSRTDRQRAQSIEAVEEYRARIAKRKAGTLGQNEYAPECDEIQIVELAS